MVKGVPMDRLVIIAIEGAEAAAAGAALAARLGELGRRVEPLTQAQLKAVASAEAAGLAAGWLSADDVAAMVVWHDGASATPEYLAAKLDPHDTPDFAAEKILDQLAEAGAIRLEQPNYTPEDEERIRARLAKLGYIE
jgi:hypothetical protein